MSDCLEYLTYKSLFFFAFSRLGVLEPYVPLFYEALSFSKSQIGILTMLPFASSFIFAPVFGLIGDIFDAQIEVILGNFTISILSTTLMLFTSSFSSVFIASLFSAVSRAAITPQIDSLVISSLPSASTYGKLRLWGAIGYGLFSFVGGVLTGKHKTENYTKLQIFQNFSPIFILFGFFSIISIIIILRVKLPKFLLKLQNPDLGKLKRNASSATFTLEEDEENIETNLNPTINPILNPSSTPIDPILDPTSTSTLKNANLNPTSTSINLVSNNTLTPESEEDTTSNTSFLQEFLMIIRSNLVLAPFAVVMFLSGFGEGVVESFLFLRIKELGGTGLIMGLARFIMCSAEVPLFQISGQLQHHFGTWPLLALTQATFTLRFVYYSLLTSPWWVLPCEILHGVTFAVTWSVACNYANQISTRKCHATMQAMLEGIHLGFGMGMGAVVGGYTYDYYGGVKLFQLSGFLTFCSTLIALIVCVARVTNPNREKGDSGGKGYVAVPGEIEMLEETGSASAI